MTRASTLSPRPPRRLAALALLSLAACPLSAPGPADPDTPAGRAAAVIGEVEQEALALEADLRALERVAAEAREDPAKIAEIERAIGGARARQEALHRALERARAELKQD